MKKFEYLSCLIDHRDMDEFLDERGKEGWELVDFLKTNGPGQYRLIFKREKMYVCEHAEHCRESGCFHKKSHSEKRSCKSECDCKKAKCVSPAKYSSTS